MSDSVASWLPSAFVSAMKGIGAQVDDANLTDEAQRLIDLWQADNRIFHNIDHVKRLLNRIDDVENWTHNPDILRVATWYHLVVFANPLKNIHDRDADNAEASAGQAHRQLQAFGVDQETCEQIAALILARRTHIQAPDDNDIVTFLDVDLSYLASIPQDYKKFVEQLRAECSSIEDCEYMKQRRQYLMMLLDRNDIFLSPLSDDLETPARQNMEAELHRLEQELKIAVPTLGSVHKDQFDDAVQPTVAAIYTDVDSGGIVTGGFLSDGVKTMTGSDSIVKTPSGSTNTGALRSGSIQLGDNVDDDTGALIIRAKSKIGKTGSIPAIQPDISDTLTPVMGIPVDQDTTANHDEDSFASTLESAVDCLDIPVQVESTKE